MRERLRTLVGRLHWAADRRRHLPAETWARLQAVLMVLDADHAPTDEDPVTDPLLGLGEVFGLDEVDLDLLMIGAAIDLDANIATAFGLLRGLPAPGRPSIGLALELCELPTVSAAALTHLGSSSRLRQQGLLAVSSSEPWLARELLIPERVLGHLVGLDEPDLPLRPLIVSSILLTLPGVETLAGAIRHGAAFSWVHAPLGAAGLSFAAAAFAALDLGCLAIQIPPGLGGGDLLDVLRSAVREAALLGRGLVVVGAERLADPANRGGFPILEGAAVPVVAVGTQTWDTDWLRRSPISLEAPPLTAADREVVWRLVGGDQSGAAGLSGLRLTPEDIADTAQHAGLRARAGSEPVTAELVRRSARQLGGAKGTAAARPARSTSFADLILPEHIMAPLARFVAWAKQRDRLIESSSLLDVGGSGTGLAALFTGSPGTGKTLAAHIVADELGLDLFPVDLPAIVDKYIGETEKHLEKVFHRAESMNVVLFFDEADALFGRRSEVKDAHDRYANQEIAYLLQRMEHFDGITILATNLRGNIDQAFSRRMSAIVHFPDPDEPTRKRLWESHLARAGKLDPHDPIEVTQLAEAAEMAGGDIRNIVLAAAYDAAADGTGVGMRHLKAATVGEFLKLGRRVPAHGFGAGGR